MSDTKQQTSEKAERIKYLRSLLITDDYKGRKVKEEALDELLDISWRDGKQVGEEGCAY